MSSSTSSDALSAVNAWHPAPRSGVVGFLAPLIPAWLSRWRPRVRRGELIGGRRQDAYDISRWPVRASIQSQVPPRPPTPILNQPLRECKIAASKTQHPTSGAGDVRCRLLPAEYAAVRLGRPKLRCVTEVTSRRHPLQYHCFRIWMEEVCHGWSSEKDRDAVCAVV